MNIMVCGLGSMGQRRIRLMQEHFAQNVHIYGVETNVERCNLCAKTYGIQTFTSIEQCISQNKIEYAFVCASPLAHAAIIMECLKLDLKVFSELNVVSDGYEEILQFKQENSSKLFLSSTMLYRKDVNYMMNKVQSSDAQCSYCYHVGQYLPDWHPWENINDFFVTNKRTNGCREIFAVQIPWIIKCFGAVDHFYVETNKTSKLNINFLDTYHVILKHNNGNTGVVTFDVVSRKPVTSLEIISNDFHISWKGKPDTLNDYDILNKKDSFVSTYEKVEQDSRYSKNIIENAYLEEIIAFFEYCNTDKAPIYTFEDDTITLKLLDDLGV